jgi:hypothetical protein
MLFDKPIQERPQPTSQRGPAAKDLGLLILGGITAAALLGIAIASFIYAASERKQLSELRNRTENRLAVMDQEVTDMGAGLGRLVAVNESSKPDFAKKFPGLLDQNVQSALRNDGSVLALENITALTRQARDLKVTADAGLIDIIAKQLLRLVATPSRGDEDAQTLTIRDRLSNPALGAIGELIGYRSFLIDSPLGQASDGAMVHGAMLILPKLHEFKPLDSASKVSGSSHALTPDVASTIARLDLMKRPEPVVTEEFKTIVVEGYDLQIDGIDARNVLFSNCKITYSGGEVALDNVYFSNCTFHMTGDSRDFANAALTPSGQTSIVKR